MRIPEYYAQAQPVISFEIFPPKTPKAEESLERVLPRLIDLNPDFMTVTYGAFGTTRAKTLDTARGIKRRFGKETACHLTCVGSSRSDLDGLLDQIRDAEINNIIALRGDPPKGDDAEGFTPPEDGCAYANELVEHIRGYERRRRVHPFGIAVGGYPEKHIEAPTMEMDLSNLRRKVDAGSDAVVTQLFFDNDDFFRYVEAARANGVTCPVVPGLLPILSRKQILKITEMCGAKLPEALARDLDEAGDDPEAAVDVGVRHCIAQATGLLQAGVPGIHFYVLNRSKPMRRIMEALPNRLLETPT